MREGNVPMVIGNVAGRWNAAGDEWTADKPMGSNTVLLVRISDAEDGEVDGVARQVHLTCDLAVRTDARVHTVFVENDTSAFKRRKVKMPNGEYQLRTFRPKFRRILSLLRSKAAQKFIAADLDRTVRDPRDLEDLIDVVEASTPRIVCDSVSGSLRLGSDADITMARVMCAMANKSSRDTARRVAAARRSEAESGQYSRSRRAYGFEDDAITVRQAEAEIIKQLCELAYEGISPGQIARDLRTEGVTPPGGSGEWTAGKVKDLILRPRNAGLVVYRRGSRGRVNWTPADVVARLSSEPIIEEEKYWALRRRLTDPARRTNTHVGTMSKWLGAGIFECPCGKALRVAPSPSSKDHHQIYRCQESVGPGHVVVRKAELDELVITTLFALVKKSRPEEIIGTGSGVATDTGALHARLGVLKDKLDDVADDYLADLITRPQMVKMTGTIRHEMDSISAQVAEAADQYNPAVKLIGVKDIRAAWEKLSLGEQRAIIRRLLNVRVNPVGRGRRVAVHERVTITPNQPASQAAASVS